MSRFRRWHIFGVDGNGKIDSFEKGLDGYGWYANEIGRALHADSVLIWAEDRDRSVGSTESFDTFVALYAIVETWRHPVDVEVRICHKSRLRPGWTGSRSIVCGLNVTIDVPHLEADIGPVLANSQLEILVPNGMDLPMSTGFGGKDAIL